MATIESLRAAVRGEVCLPGDAGYAKTCAIWNGAIRKRPRLVVRASAPEDVVAALAHARAEGLEVSVRGGGHNFAGSALTNGGLTIDLSPMNAMAIDVATRRGVCGGGTTWGQLDAAAQAFGLATPGGFISHTGVAGLTLGGGLGWLSRKAGLSIDCLVGAQVVTADGRVLRASADENPDLFWGLRGGGGNFGVVTSFEFRLLEVGPLVHVGLFFVPPERGRELLRLVREHTRDLPDNYGAFVGGLHTPPAPFVPPELQHKPAFLYAVVGYESVERHAELVAPVQALGPFIELVTSMPFTALQQMFDAAAPWGILGYEKALFLDELSDGAIDVIVEHTHRKSSPMSFLPMFVLGGAFGRVGNDDTAFGGSRTTRFAVNMAAISADPAQLAADTGWARTMWTALKPYASGVGGYVNFMSEFEEDRIRAAYGEAKYARLAKLKAKYDPGNVFHINGNIKPATAAPPPVAGRPQPPRPHGRPRG
jgi:FAD/FMN-containing dehydrogenase